jgi:deoxyribose-phosphate aldolase
MAKSTEPIAQTNEENARRVLAFLDLTELSDECDEAAVRRLCTAAVNPIGKVAAVCVWPGFVPVAASMVSAHGVLVASVVNFPKGDSSIETVLAEVAQATADGADEIDLVLPWQMFLEGDERAASQMVTSVRGQLETTTLKVILETGLYPNQQKVAQASQLAIDCGADFLKTSTGKVAISATHEAVETMLHTIRNTGRVVGIKPSGGIRSLDQALPYLATADSIMGGQWATCETFRFGASALHDDIMNVLQKGH